MRLVARAHFKMEHSLSTSAHAANNIPDVAAPIVEAMSSYPAPWALCGGWAVDAWLGRHTRDHGDVDVSVYIQDQRVLLEHLRGWQLVPHDPVTPDTNVLWTGREVQHPGHFHGRPDTEDPIPPDGALWPQQGWLLDVQLDQRDGDDWILHRDPLIAIPIADAVVIGPWGVPMVVPEVLLFWKSRDLRRRDKADFDALLPVLGESQRNWLRTALETARHPWLPTLTATPA
jgi:hypothetical protein